MALEQYEEGYRQEYALTILERTNCSANAVFRKAGSAW